MDRLAYTVDEARQQLGGVSKHLFYDWLKDGLISTVKVGRRRFVTHEAIVRFLEEHAC